MSRYHYDDDFDDLEYEREFQARLARMKKQEACKHPNATPPSPMGFGECPDCGALI